jgi:hypothetical protein
MTGRTAMPTQLANAIPAYEKVPNEYRNKSSCFEYR